MRQQNTATDLQAESINRQPNIATDLKTIISNESKTVQQMYILTKHAIGQYVLVGKCEQNTAGLIIKHIEMNSTTLQQIYRHKHEQHNIAID